MTRHRPLTGPDDPRHGTRAGYMQGCGCDPCREANRVYCRARYEARRDSPVRPVTTELPDSRGAKPMVFHRVALPAGWRTPFCRRLLVRPVDVRRQPGVYDVVYPSGRRVRHHPRWLV